MNSMHCPSCGAEGRIPKDKVNVRLLCRRCMKSFHQKPDGRIVAGDPPPEPRVAAPGDAPWHETDAVERDLEALAATIKSVVPKIAIVTGIVVIAALVWMGARRGLKAANLFERSLDVARLLASDDASGLRSLAVSGTGDDAAKLAEELRPEFEARPDILRGPPSVEIGRNAADPGPGLARVVAVIRPGTPPGRIEGALARESAGNGANMVEVPLVLAGDDRSGWLLDGGRSLEAFRKSRAPEPPPTTVKGGRSGAAATGPARGTGKAADPDG